MGHPLHWTPCWILTGSDRMGLVKKCLVYHISVSAQSVRNFIVSTNLVLCNYKLLIGTERTGLGIESLEWKQRHSEIRELPSLSTTAY